MTDREATEELARRVVGGTSTFRGLDAVYVETLLAEHDRRADRDQLHTALTAKRRTRQQLWNILGRPDGAGLDIELLDAVADAIDSRNRYRAELDRLDGADFVIRCDDPAHQERDQLHAAPGARTMTSQPEVRTEWGYQWRRNDGTTFVRPCLNEDDAREWAGRHPTRAVVLRREIRTGPWTVPTREATR